MLGIASAIDRVADSCANLWDMTVGPGVADMSRAPTSIIDEGPQRTVHRYRPTRRAHRHAPVLLVPPLAAPASCFDLRRSCSLSQHLLALGYPTYLVDYGPISFSDRQLGLEHWGADVTGGRLVTGLYSALGGAPAPLVSLGFQLTALDKRITKPLTLLRNLDNRDLLAHIEAVDDYMAHMLAYPGRTFAQLYHRFFRINDLADGRVDLSGRCIDLADVDVPTLVVAGTNDVLAPAAAVVAVEGLLTGAPEVRVEREPGGHLGGLTGRGARNHTWRQ